MQHAYNHTVSSSTSKRQAYRAGHTPAGIFVGAKEQNPLVTFYDQQAACVKELELTDKSMADRIEIGRAHV